MQYQKTYEKLNLLSPAVEIYLMINKKLGVNIDHVATIRNARGEIYPNPLKAALLAQRSGADSRWRPNRFDSSHGL